MLIALITTKLVGPALTLFALFEGEGFGEPDSFFNKYLNIPGFEAWKFLNLFLFIGIMYWLLRKPLGNAFRTRREEIRRDLIRAQEERQAAEAKLAEVDARLAKLDAESAFVREQADREAAAESERIARLTVEDAEKLREQARREIEAAGKTVKQDLRRYAAEESVKLAEQMIRSDIRPDDDARLINRNVQELGGPAN
ncbi:MAG: ATP synthase F0 subunit B [Pyrinomonadaceae bacterium]